jgi:3-methyladenine DNA glycosylase AlkD
MSKTYTELLNLILIHKNHKEAKIKYNFFTKNGEYATYDKFLGINMGTIVHLVNKFYKKLNVTDIHKLIFSPYNELRHIGLLFIKKLYPLNKSKYFKIIVKNIKYVNNWNLVDSIASVCGDYFYNYDDIYLKKWIGLRHPWKVRLCIVSLFYYLKKNNIKNTKKMISRVVCDHQLVIKSLKWLLNKMNNKKLKK